MFFDIHFGNYLLCLYDIYNETLKTYFKGLRISSDDEDNDIYICKNDTAPRNNGISIVCMLEIFFPESRVQWIF